jgi:hypothetical protein
MVALFNGVGGGAVADRTRGFHNLGPVRPAGAQHLVAMILSAIIGSISFAAR